MHLQLQVINFKTLLLYIIELIGFILLVILFFLYMGCLLIGSFLITIEVYIVVWVSLHAPQLTLIILHGYWVTWSIKIGTDEKKSTSN